MYFTQMKNYRLRTNQVEMIKKNDFNMDEYLDLSDEKKDMAQIIEKLMELMAREDTNNVFGKLLNG